MVIYLANDMIIHLYRSLGPSHAGRNTLAFFERIDRAGNTQ